MCEHVESILRAENAYSVLVGISEEKVTLGTRKYEDDNIKGDLNEVYVGGFALNSFG